MKTLFALIVCSVMLFGCSKDLQTDREAVNVSQTDNIPIVSMPMVMKKVNVLDTPATKMKMPMRKATAEEMIKYAEYLPKSRSVNNSSDVWIAESPMVGTFYWNTSIADSTPRVNVGNKVVKDQTLYFLEARMIFCAFDYPFKSGVVIMIGKRHRESVEVGEKIMLISDVVEK